MNRKQTDTARGSYVAGQRANARPLQRLGVQRVAAHALLLLHERRLAGGGSGAPPPLAEQRRHGRRTVGARCVPRTGYANIVLNVRGRTHKTHVPSRCYTVAHTHVIIQTDQPKLKTTLMQENGNRAEPITTQMCTKNY